MVKVRKGSWPGDVLVVNASDEAVSNVELFVEREAWLIGPLPPGASKLVTGITAKSLRRPGDPQPPKGETFLVTWANAWASWVDASGTPRTGGLTRFDLKPPPK